MPHCWKLRKSNARESPARRVLKGRHKSDQNRCFPLRNLHFPPQSGLQRQDFISPGRTNGHEGKQNTIQIEKRSLFRPSRRSLGPPGRKCSERVPMRTGGGWPLVQYLPLFPGAPNILRPLPTIMYFQTVYKDL